MSRIHNDKYIPADCRNYQCPLTRTVLIERIKQYGFIECGEMLSFLECVCGTYPDRCALIWLRDKLAQCLGQHDNGSDYFSALRTLGNELDYAIFVIRWVIWIRLSLPWIFTYQSARVRLVPLAEFINYRFCYLSDTRNNVKTTPPCYLNNCSE